MAARLVLLAVLLLLGAGAWAGDLAPALPKAKGGACVEEPAVMRRGHMDMLRHQRDDTLRQGVRGGPHSLKDCVSCHATTSAAGTPVPVTAEGQFCQSCHAYAAVAPDCFSCHAAVPGGATKAASR